MCKIQILVLGQGYMADNKDSSQEDVPQYGGDKAVKVWGFELQPNTRNSISVGQTHGTVQCSKCTRVS